MRIPKGKTQVIDTAPTPRFLLVVDAMDGDIRMEKDGRALITLQTDETGAVTATVCLSDGMVAVLRGEDAYHKEVILTSGYARLGLYVNGVLQDEEFFYAPLDYAGSVIHPGSYMHFEAGYEYHSMPETAITPEAVGRVDGYLPIGREMTVRALLPYAYPDRLHLFYMDCRRGGRAKRGAGAFRLDALYSADGENYGLAPMALPIDSVEEERMVDAALAVVDGRYYLYYLVDYRAGRALSCAVSEDGYSFLKTGLDVDIPGVDAAALSAITVVQKGAEVFLCYATKNGVFTAKSVDLLHFRAPVPTAIAGEVTALHAANRGEQVYLFADTAQGSMLYTEDGERPLPVRGARGAYYRGAWYLFSVGEHGEIQKAVIEAL